MNPGKGEANELMMMIIAVEVAKCSPSQLNGGRFGRMFADFFRDFFASFLNQSMGNDKIPRKISRLCARGG
jgi:hypothetical protein